MKKYILFTSIAAATLVSCNSINIDDMETRALNISVKNAADTKAVIEGTTLPATSEIGIFPVDLSGRTYDGNTIANIKYTATGEGDSQVWNTTSDIMLSTAKATIHSYYPYDESVYDVTAIPIEATSEVQKDWMWGTPATDIDNTNNTAVITMNHALAAVKLNIKKENYFGAGKVTSVSFNSNGAGTSAVMNATTGALSNVKGAGYTFKSTKEFTIGNEATAVSFIAVPTNTAAPLTLDVIVDGKHMKVQTADVTLQAGNIYECNLSMNISVLSISKLNVTKWTVEQMGDVELNPFAPVVSFAGTTTNIRAEHDYKNKALTVTAYPTLEGYSVNKATVTGGVPTQSVDENGVRTIVITDIVSDVKVTFAGTTYVPWARIQHVDGTLYTAEEWLAAEEAGTVTDADANGVAVRYSKYTSCPHIIHPKYLTSKMYWSNNMTVEVPGVTLTSAPGTALLDVNGKANTDAILTAVVAGTILDAPAAQYCAETVFANGQQGYLPAVGELQAWQDNMTVINACMDAIGADQVCTLSSGQYTWSSTQKSKGYVYVSNYNGSISEYSKNNNQYARPVSAFSL